VVVIIPQQNINVVPAKTTLLEHRIYNMAWTRCASSFHYSLPFRSAACCDLVVPRTRLQLGNWAFCVAGPVARNSLPLHICSASTISTFKSMFKTSFLSFLLHWLTVSRVRAANIVRRPCSDSMAMLLRLINCRFIIIIIVIIIIIIIITLTLTHYFDIIFLRFTHSAFRIK